MTQPDGIDMRRSGWTNPEGLTRESRPAVAPEPVPDACDAEHPDGWICDLRPGHGGWHRADDGTPEGAASWPQGETLPRSIVRPPVETAVDPDHRTVQATTVPFALAQVGAIASDALNNPNPAAWAVALQRIVERIHG